MKSKTRIEIMSDYSSLSMSEKVDVLTSALYYMEQYNGRTRADCIALGMGYEIKNGVYIINIDETEIYEDGECDGSGHPRVD